MRAAAFARRAHEGQFRKYDGRPYIVHPEEVATIVADHGGSPEMQAAAWLHDVVEDTPVTIEQIEAEFGLLVAFYVGSLTDSESGNRAQRKEASRRRLSTSGRSVQTIKFADMLSNGPSIRDHDPDFWKVYRYEIALALSVMLDGDSILRHRVYLMIEQEDRPC